MLDSLPWEAVKLDKLPDELSGVPRLLNILRIYQRTIQAFFQRNIYR